ncbi:hypothetical protein NEF87_003507 [Candidatus Lokiarchaeum ossiferum]|uniref:Uncharacterized protein n=1 Tax=Candidatus Lokiarchaeum ossiferum TaxID=2951803 RepID=A0ABY6HUL5_9ARCH|nr:hypothetical protein NEF87_003507 [Candidatus Lokiarchaeum sp. B-35]
MNAFSLQVDPHLKENFGLNSYKNIGCMKFKIKDPELNKQVMARSKFSNVLSYKKIKRLAKVESENLCYLCENFGLDLCPFSKSQIESKLLEDQHQKTKCSICGNRPKNFHDLLFYTKHPDLICFTCYRAMEKGVLFQYLKQKLRITTSGMLSAPISSLIIIYIVFGGKIPFLDMIKPNWLYLTVFILISFLIGFSPFILIPIYKKRKLLRIESAAEKYSYQEQDLTEYSYDKIIKILFTPEIKPRSE